MARPLFGFRQRRGRIVPEPSELQIVRRVLAAPRGSPVSLARLSPFDSYKALEARVHRIRQHRTAYRTGRALLGMPPDPRLAALVRGAGNDVELDDDGLLPQTLPRAPRREAVA